MKKLIFTFLSLSAAHCILNKKSQTQINARDLLMLLGAFNIDDRFEEGRVAVTPSEIFIHDDWNPNTDRFNDDIAILMMENEISFANFIRPICLWNSATEASVDEGIVVGWGKSINSSAYHESTPKELRVPIIHDNQKCYHEDYIFAKLGSEKTFCAGKEGIGVCTGDSGSGLFIEVDNVFYLKGIVSSSLRDLSGCYTKNFAIYTNVMKYLDWIESKTKRKKVETCGVMSGVMSLVHGGKLSSRKKFPWIVAISKKTTRDWSHWGSGSLISRQHVVAGAISVSYINRRGENFEPAEKEWLKLYFGITDLNQANDREAVVVDGATGIEKVLVYPGAKHSDNSRKYPGFGEFAVVFLKDSITFTDFIFPVCLWKFNTKISDQIGKFAYGVGFGKDGNGKMTKIRKHVVMTITDESECNSKWGEYIENNSEGENFCAKGDESNFANFFDQPLYMKVNETWHLRGIMSLIDDTKKKIMLYESQSGKFVDWILKVIKS
jgi:secreted trypsin-like serine protease